MEKKNFNNRRQIMTYPKFQLASLTGNLMVTGSMFGSGSFPFLEYLTATMNKKL